MADIRKYIQDKLLFPLKAYPTAIQDTLLELITERLETLYDYTVAFPEIVTPNMTRLDILKAIADQFLFTVREEADLQEQLDILDNILTVYNKRGSIDTIENMWKYYGGDLPKDVQVIVPSYNLFRWNVSPFSGLDVFQDATRNRTGVYEVKLTNSTYSIPKLKDFMLKELVAAGNYIYFSNAISSEIREGKSESYYQYNIMRDDFIHLQYMIVHSQSGMILSGPEYASLSGSYNGLVARSSDAVSDTEIETRWSGKPNLFVEITKILDYEDIFKWNYLVKSKKINLEFKLPVSKDIKEPENILTLCLEPILYSAPSYKSIKINRDLYNAEGQRMREKIFTLGDSLLGEPLGYEAY